ncbi:hypothetical protein [Halodurantibacterium flavum]|uniref:Tetratricopeptide repeat protein n=1 Tax=Halodurantibacterium flavum TaxID=1382802 RepID=A0ABW4S6H4_9RHOB
MRPHLSFVPALALSLVLALPALGQTPGDQDLEALRFYLSQQDQASAQAELQRLQAAFPNWTPPADINTLRVTQPSVEIDEIYRQIARGDVAGARRTIETTQGTYPGWSPPAEMTNLLRLTEAQQQFDQAVTQGRAQDAITIARNTPTLLRCDRVNNAWQLAEMHQQLQDTANALSTHRGVLNSCTNFSEIVATLEKASVIASPAQLDELFALVRPRFPANATTLDELQTRLRGGQPAAPATAPATATPAAPAAQQPARPAATPAPQAQPQPQAAPPAQAATPAPSAGSPFAGLPARGDGRIAQVRAAASAGDWASCLARSARPRSAEVLYERAWCAYNADRSLEALAAFRVAERAGLGATVTRDARFGMALAYLANNMTEEAARLAAVTDLTGQQRLEVETIILDQRGVRAYQLRDYAQAVSYFNALEQLQGHLRRDLAMLRGYAYLNSGNRMQARAEFERLNQQLSTAETRQALAATADY